MEHLLVQFEAFLNLLL